MDPLTPPTDMLAFRKYTDLKYGTQKETTAKSTVAINVTMKPGVAGRMKPIGGFVEPWGVCFRTLESVLLRDRIIKRDKSYAQVRWVAENVQSSRCEGGGGSGFWHYITKLVALPVVMRSHHLHCRPIHNPLTLLRSNSYFF